MPIVFGGTVESLEKRLLGYPKAAIDAFLAATGSAPAKTHRDAASAAAAVLFAGEPVRRLVAALPRGPKALVHIVAVRPQKTGVATIAEVARDVEHFEPRDVERWLSVLAESGLVVVTGGGAVEVIPDLVRGTGDATAARLAGITPDQAQALPAGVLIAAAASVIAEDPPRLTQRMRPHARWLSKFEARVVGPAAPSEVVYRAFNAAGGTGVIASVSEGREMVILPHPQAADRVFALPPEKLATLFARAAGSQTSLAAAIVARAFSRAAGGTLELHDAHVAARELASLDWYDRADLGIPAQFTLFEVARLLGTAEWLGLIELARGDRITTFAKPKPRTDEARWTVLPNFRVLVPADVHPGAIYRLGLIARLERVDRITEFSLDRESVARRVRCGLRQSALEILEERSAFEIPEAVRREIAVWDAESRAVRTYVGGVFVAESPAHAETMRSPALRLREIAPGVFFVDDEGVVTTLTALRKAGVATTRGDGLARGDDDEPAVDAEARLAEFQASLVRLAKAKVPRLSARGAQQADAHHDPAVGTAHAGGDPAAEPGGEEPGARPAPGRSVTRTPAELAQQFPAVFAACNGSADLLRRACGLETSELRSAATRKDGVEIRRVVHFLSLPGDDRRTPAAAQTTEGEDAPRSAPTSAAPPASPSPTPATPPPPPRPRRATRDASAPAAPAPAPAAPEAPAFQPVPPGELRRILEAAALSGAEVSVLYTGKDSKPRERIIVPVRVTDARGTTWIEAREPAIGNSLASFRLDRVSAIR